MLDRQQLVDLPNLGRNPFMMSKLAQNVTPVGDPHYNRMQDQSGSSQISIAGGPVRGNNYLLDGIPITDAANRAIIIPTLEAVEQVKVQSNTYDAEMARTGGGMFNTYLKSGANDWHGSLFGTLRQTSWAANNFFNNAAGIALPEQPNRTFGASFGGPVSIPKVYKGREPHVLLAGLGRLRGHAIEHFAILDSDGAGTDRRLLAEQDLERRVERDLRSEEYGVRRQHLHAAAVCG